MKKEQNSQNAEIQALNIPVVSGCLYEFLYNSCIYESSWATVSLHYTMEGAEKAMNEHKDKAYKEWLEYNEECIKSDPEFYAKYPNKFGEHEDWCVKTIEVLP